MYNEAEMARMMATMPPLVQNPDLISTYLGYSILGTVIAVFLLKPGRLASWIAFFQNAISSFQDDTPEKREMEREMARRKTIAEEIKKYDKRHNYNNDNYNEYYTNLKQYYVDNKTGTDNTKVQIKINKRRKHKTNHNSNDDNIETNKRRSNF